MNIKIPIAEPDIGTEELQNVTEAVKSGWISSKGPFIGEFERNFSNYIGAKYGVATSNGTTALHLALVALGLGKGDKVLVPSLDFVAVANAVTYTGAEPVFIDSHPKYWCMDPSKLKIDKNTKAIIAVHLYGHPCDMSEIQKVANDHGLFVLEDCAESHGAEYNGKKTGQFGIISCFSFYGNKIITTGEGGMCLTSDEELAEKMILLRDHGMNRAKKYWHDVIGYNYRMTNLQAALGVAQLNKIERLIEKKRSIANTYKGLLQDLQKTSSVSFSPEMPWAKSVYWLFSILVDPSRRDRLINYLEKQGIESRPFFYPSHILPPYNHNLSLPISEKLSAMGVNLPSGAKLDEKQIEEVVESLKNFLSTN